MKRTIDFLAELQHNNNKEWFDRNRAEYREVQAEFNAFVTELIDEISSFDPDIKGLTVKDCTYRIYRDTRFSRDKSPYKTHMGAYVCRGGKKSGFAGYYFHVEPKGSGLLGGNLMTAGIYMPEPKVLRSIREEILDNGDRLMETIRKAEGFSVDMSNTLKRTPVGFPAGTTYDEYLRLKDLYMVQYVTDDYLLEKNLAVRVAAEFKKTYGFNSQLNRAVEYAYEEM